MEIKNNYKKVISLKENSVLNYDLKANSSACLFFCDYAGLVTEININLDTNSSCELYGFFKNINETVFIPQGAIHRIENLFKKPVKIMEIQIGVILKETDIIRYKDVYGRVN